MPNVSKLMFVEVGQSIAEIVDHVSTYLKAVD